MGRAADMLGDDGSLFFPYPCGPAVAGKHAPDIPPGAFLPQASLFHDPCRYTGDAIGLQVYIINTNRFPAVPDIGKLEAIHFAEHVSMRLHDRVFGKNGEFPTVFANMMGHPCLTADFGGVKRRALIVLLYAKDIGPVSVEAGYPFRRLDHLYGLGLVRLKHTHVVREDTDFSVVVPFWVLPLESYQALQVAPAGQQSEQGEDGPCLAFAG